jgi:aminomethyltransferase
MKPAIGRAGRGLLTLAALQVGRYLPAPMSEALRRTPLFSQHQALGGRIVPFAGYELPVQYSGVTEEHNAVRRAAGLFDVSHMGELTLDGPGAVGALDHIVTGSIGKLAIGRAQYTVACNDAGTILDDLIVYRLGEQAFLVVCNASNREKIAAHFAQHAAPRCTYADRSDEFALLALQGPAALAITAQLGGAELSALPRFGVARAQVASVSVIAARTGYTGEDGFELFCAPSDAPRLFGALLETGKPLGLLPIGLGARDTLRLEARLMLYGNDIDETTTPYDAGIGYTVALDKPDFIGKAALAAAKAQGPSRRLVGLEMIGRGIARHGYPVLDAAGQSVGQVTSGGPGLSIGKNIALAYVPSALAHAGTALAVEIRGKAIEAVVVKTPFYKRG